VGSAPITGAASADSIGSRLWAIAAYKSANGKEGIQWQTRYSTL
jgi:hypothetical protein